MKGAALMERRTEAIKLKLAGATWDEVAEACGYSSRGAAHADIQREMERRREVEKEELDALRQVETDRLEALWATAWALLQRKNVTVSHGKVIYITDPETGEKMALQDDAPTLMAIDRLVRISERKAKLLGLDAPLQVEHGGNIRYEVVGISPELLGGERAKVDSTSSVVLELPSAEGDEELE